MLYIQISMIGFIILLIPLLSRRCGYMRDWQLFCTVDVIVMLDLALETIAWLLDGKTFPGAYVFIYLANFFTILLQPTMGLLWLYYTFEELGIRLPKKSPLHLLCALPLAANALFLLTNYWTHFIFTIGTDNIYMRGGLFWIDVIISFLYPVAATVISLIVSINAKSSAKKRSCYILASFLLPPVIAAVIQVLWYGSFLFLTGFAISLLIVFINLQNEQITVDFLTRINNRASFIAYYERKVHAVKQGYSLYLLMIDVDFFKRINDTYGHVAGDQVLTTVADQLKIVCSGQNCFLARLGGDEFGILFECDSMRYVRAFVDKIHASLDEFNADSCLSSPVTLSIGYASYDGVSHSIDDLIQRADAMMYTQKARRHMIDMNRQERSQKDSEKEGGSL